LCDPSFPIAAYGALPVALQFFLASCLSLNFARRRRGPSSIALSFATVHVVGGVPQKGIRKLPPIPTEDPVLDQQLKFEKTVEIKYTGWIDFSREVHDGPKTVTTRWSIDCIQEPRGCAEAPVMSGGVRKRPTFDMRFEPFLSLKKPTSGYQALACNFKLSAVVKDSYIGARGNFKSTIKIKSATYKRFGDLTEEEINGGGFPSVDSDGNTISLAHKKILLRRVISLFQGANSGGSMFVVANM